MVSPSRVPLNFDTWVLPSCSRVTVKVTSLSLTKPSEMGTSLSPRITTPVNLSPSCFSFRLRSWESPLSVTSTHFHRPVALDALQRPFRGSRSNRIHDPVRPDRNESFL